MKLNTILKTPLLKASFYNFIIVAIKVISGIVVSKVFAVFLGPTGLALIGNFRNFIKLAFGFTAEGYQSGTIRYISENHSTALNKKKIVATIFQLSLMFSISIGIFSFCFSNFLSEFLFQTSNYAKYLKLFGLGLPFMSFNLLIIYVLNGIENYKGVTIITSILFLINMFFNVLFAINWQLEGALIALTIGPVVAFFINIMALGNDRYILLDAFNYNNFSISVLKKMNIYLLMSVYSVVIVSTTFLSIRNLIIKKLSIIDAGYWEAMNRISSFYLMFFISLTSFYLLPKLSKTHNLKTSKID